MCGSAAGIGAGSGASDKGSGAASGSDAGSSDGGGAGSGSAWDSASVSGAGGVCTVVAMRGGASSATSHSQQSLHFKHFSQIWLSHASLVHRTQIRVEGSSQILHWNGIEWLSFPGRLAGRGQQGAATLRFAVHHLQLLLLIRGEIDQVPLEARAVGAVLGG